LSSACGRSLKYENVYLHAYVTGGEARLGIGHWIDGYNARRPHQALAYKTPDEVYASSPRSGPATPPAAPGTAIKAAA
jgi:putative transposase